MESEAPLTTARNISSCRVIIERDGEAIDCVLLDYLIFYRRSGIGRNALLARAFYPFIP